MKNVRDQISNIVLLEVRDSVSIFGKSSDIIRRIIYVHIWYNIMTKSGNIRVILKNVNNEIVSMVIR